MGGRSAITLIADAKLIMNDARKVLVPVMIKKYVPGLDVIMLQETLKRGEDTALILAK